MIEKKSGLAGRCMLYCRTGTSPGDIKDVRWPSILKAIDTSDYESSLIYSSRAITLMQRECTHSFLSEGLRWRKVVFVPFLACELNPL